MGQIGKSAYMQLQWKKLDRDSSIKVIDSVKSAADMGMFNVGTCEVTMARVSFYEENAIFKITNFASVPSFSFEYLGDGTFFHYLDGTTEAIHKANDSGKLKLRDSNVLDYIAFYFERIANVNPDMDDVTIIVNPHDMPLLDSLDPMAYAAVMANFKPAEIMQNSDMGYTVETAIYTESMAMRATIEVTPRGRVRILDQKMIMNEMLDSNPSEALI